MIMFITILSSLFSLSVNLCAADYDTDLIPYESQGSMYNVYDYSNKLFSNRKPFSANDFNTVVSYDFATGFSSSSNHYELVFDYYFNDVNLSAYNKDGIKDVYFYVHCEYASLNYKSGNNIIFNQVINQPAYIRINDLQYHTDQMLYNNDGVFIYRLPLSDLVADNFNISYISIITYAKLSSSVLFTGGYIGNRVESFKILYSQSDADRIIASLKNQSEDDKQDVIDKTDKVNQSIDALESQANAIEGLNRPNISIDKNPVDISGTSIPLLISHITNHPYLMSLFALLASLVLIAALLYGV